MNNVDYGTLYQKYVVERKSMQKVADELEIAAGTVYKYIHKWGIPITPKNGYPVTDATRDHLKKLHEERRGATFTEEWKKKISEARQLKGIGHKKKRADGYVALYYPTYPRSNKDGYVMEHDYVMEQHLGRYLEDGEIVHHKNFDKADNRLDNLQVMTKSEHMSYHSTLAHRKKRGDDLSIQ